MATRLLLSCLPKTVLAELELRDADPTRPVNHIAIESLRNFFNSNDRPNTIAVGEGCDGFIDVLERLGGTPRSSDPLVYGLEYNPIGPGECYHYDSEDEDDVDEEGVVGAVREGRPKQLRLHTSRVRLFRYREFIEAQKQQGLGWPEKHWTFSFNEVELQDESNSDDGEEDVLTPHQMKLLGEGFTSDFFTYTNLDRLVTGKAEGVVLRDPNAPLPEGFPSGAHAFSFELDDWVLNNQIIELTDRYREEKCPLGAVPVHPEGQEPTSAGAPARTKGNRKKKGKKKNTLSSVSNTDKRQHTTRIQNATKALLESIEGAMISSSINTMLARIICSLSLMLAEAIRVDFDITRFLCGKKGGAALLRIREHALKLSSDESFSRGHSILWWESSQHFTRLLGQAVNVLTIGSNTPRIVYTPEENDSEDACLAARFVSESLMPVLLKSLQGPHREQFPALDALHDVVVGCRLEETFRLVKKKETWSTLERIALASGESLKAPPDGSETTFQRNERVLVVLASESAVAVIHQICARGMIVQNPSGLAVTTPSELTTKLAQRGVVHLLLKLARSPSDRIASNALDALGQISRLKDCRRIMFQDPAGIELIAETLASSNGNRVSPCMLLLLHLLWDKEWRDPVMAIQPPAEQTTVKWAAFGMNEIVKRADAIRAKNAKIFAGKEDGTIDTSWIALETSSYEGVNANLLMNRTMMVLLTMIQHSRESQDRLLKANVHILGATCLDIPAEATYRSAFGVLCNFQAVGRFDCIAPDAFPEPELIGRAISFRMNQMIAYNDRGPGTQIIMTLLQRMMTSSPPWGSVIRRVAEDEEDLAFFLGTKLFKGAAAAAPPAARQRANERRNTGTISDGIPAGCTTITGKMASCDQCGRMEVKKGDLSLKACSRCHCVRYCSKDCQVKAWKEHKKECKKLAAAKAEV